MTLTITDALTVFQPPMVAQAWDLPLAEVEQINTSLHHLFDDESVSNNEMLAQTDIIDARYGMRDIE